MVDILTLIALFATLLAIIWYSFETRWQRHTAEKQLRLGVDQHHNESGFRPCRIGGVHKAELEPPYRVYREFKNFGQLAINVDLVGAHDSRIILDDNKQLGIVAPGETIKLIFPEDLDISQHDHCFIAYDDIQGTRRQIRVNWVVDRNGLDAYPVIGSDVRTLL